VFWCLSFQDTTGIAFLVDARCEELSHVLHEEKLPPVPLFVLANKQDPPAAAGRAQWPSRTSHGR
jgi:hypothetical protein